MKAEWISVKDELPKEGQEVLVQTEATICETYFEKGDFDYNRITQAYANEAGIGTADKVLKWKPIQKTGWDMSSEEIIYKNICDSCYDEKLGNLVNTPIGQVIKAMEEYHQSQLQALKEEVEKLYNKSVEELENLSNEDPIVFSKGKRNALKEVLNLITNLENK